MSRFATIQGFRAGDRMIKDVAGADRVSASNVISVSGWQIARMKNPLIAQVEAYWQALCHDGKVPLRSAVDPRGIEAALEHAFILERIAPGTARFRLAGMHLNDLMGMEVRGMPLTAFFDPDSRTELGAALEHVFEMPCSAFYSVSSTGECGNGAVTGQMVLLPLRSDLGDISRALGCFVTSGPTGKTPHRFTLDRHEMRTLGGNAVHVGEPTPSRREMETPEKAVPENAMAEAPRPFDRANGSDTRPGAHLRIVHDADRKKP